jgi:UDP-2,3-diacylglucosamine pyrophosphatase LpxH
MKVLILSDFHFGHPASKLPRFLDRLSALCRGFDRVVLNGDTLDRFEGHAAPEQAEAHFNEVRERFRSRSGPPELIPGNHDPAVSENYWIYLQHSATLVFHGDSIADCTHPTKKSEQILSSVLQRKWAELGGRPRKFEELLPVHRQLQRQVLQDNPPLLDPKNPLTYVFRTAYPPQKVFHVLRYWYLMPRRVAQLAATFGQPVRHAVVGHSHLPGSWNVMGIHVLNTGSFMPGSRPFAVAIDGTAVRLLRLAELLRSPRVFLEPMRAQATE